MVPLLLESTTPEKHNVLRNGEPVNSRTAGGWERSNTRHDNLVSSSPQYTHRSSDFCSASFWAHAREQLCVLSWRRGYPGIRVPALLGSVRASRNGYPLKSVQNTSENVWATLSMGSRQGTALAQMPERSKYNMRYSGVSKYVNTPASMPR